MYLYAGIAGIIVLIIIWIQDFELKLISVWILTVVLTLGSIKSLGIVFFYDRFSGNVSTLVNKMQDSKKAYWSVVASRGILSIILLVTTLYFSGFFGVVR